MKHALALSVLATFAGAQAEAPLEGHSFHGEAFNEGPRQAAYAMPDRGNVNFPISAATDEIQRFFNQGLAQLHGFWFFEAERTFRQIASLDRDCAMAYWGMAMANVDNPERAVRFARVAWLKRGLADERERLFIDGLARFYEVEGSEEPEFEAPDAEAPAKDAKAREQEREALKERAARLAADYEEIVWEYPDDIEAKALLVNRLWLNRRFGLAITSRHANDALLQQIFAAQPDHPAHHYRIHLWDDPEQAEHVVDSALSSGPARPEIAHMWHMGGHIFARLGRHTDASWQQEASARVDHAQMIRDLVLPDQIHNFAHNNEWLTRSMRHHGRVREAVELAKNMIELPRHPKYNTLEMRYGSAIYGRRRLLETLELFEQWDELVSLSKTMYLEPFDLAADRGLRTFVLGKAHAYLGDEQGFDEALATLDVLIDEAKLERAKELVEAEEEALVEGLARDAVRDAMDGVLDEHQGGLDDLRSERKSLVALDALLKGEDFEGNLEILKENRFEKAHLARLALAEGHFDTALELAREAVEDRDGRIYFHANLAHVLNATGHTDEALEVFDELRSWSARADLDLPVFERLAPLAEARRLPSDWRVEPRDPFAMAAEVVGEELAAQARPDLDTLGPLRWTPPLAKPWSLPDANGGEVALSDYEGRPVLVIFFLGFGCVHCVEQLHAFTPAAEPFAQAGIDIVTIGTDTVAQLSDSTADDTPETAFPFPILSDASLDVFRRYRAYDDFEHMPLHGTYLVDGSGQIRWHDISYEPFMDWEFLLAESERLLGLPAPGAPELTGSTEALHGAGTGGQ